MSNPSNFPSLGCPILSAFAKGGISSASSTVLLAIPTISPRRQTNLVAVVSGVGPGFSPDTRPHPKTGL